MDTCVCKTMASVASLEKIEIIRSQEFMPSKVRLKFLKKMIILHALTTGSAIVYIYCLRHIVDFIILLLFGTGCVDGSGSLSGGAFNQLKLVTLNIV